MVTPTQPPSTPPTAPVKSSGSPLVWVLGCLAAVAVVLVVTVGIALAVWKPWKKKTPTTRPPSTTVSGPGAIAVEEPDETPELAVVELQIGAGNTDANGATFKVFSESGETIASGTVPGPVSVPADSRCKVVASKPGFRSWEDWQAAGDADSSAQVLVTLEALPPDRVIATICTATGKSANQYCPTVAPKEFPKGEEPSVCTTHGEPPARVGVKICTSTGKRANRNCPTTVTKEFDQGRVPGYCTAHKPPRAQRVTVGVCSVSGKQANQYCPNVVPRDFPAGGVPGVCTQHREPAAQKVSARICDGTGGEAAKYCSSTHMQQFLPGDVPPRCTAHTQPPGKPLQGQETWKYCPDCNAKHRDGARKCRDCGYRF